MNLTRRANGLLKVAERRASYSRSSKVLSQLTNAFCKPLKSDRESKFAAFSLEAGWKRRRKRKTETLSQADSLRKSGLLRFKRSSESNKETER